MWINTHNLKRVDTIATGYGELHLWWYSDGKAASRDIANPGRGPLPLCEKPLPCDVTLWEVGVEMAETMRDIVGHTDLCGACEDLWAAQTGAPEVWAVLDGDAEASDDAADTEASEATAEKVLDDLFSDAAGIAVSAALEDLADAGDTMADDLVDTGSIFDDLEEKRASEVFEPMVPNMPSKELRALDANAHTVTVDWEPEPVTNASETLIDTGALNLKDRDRITDIGTDTDD